MAKPKNPRPGVLRDHKQIGKRFIPPFVAQLGPMNEVSWRTDIIPDVLWLALLNERHGLIEGAELCRQLAVSAKGVVKTDQLSWFGAASTFSLLDNTQQAAVVAELRSCGALDKVRDALLAFPMFYPACPLNFLYEQPQPASPDVLHRFKTTLNSLFDRGGREATFAQANGIYIAFTTDMLKVAPGLALANFPAIEAFPHTEESKTIASGVRAAINMFCRQDDQGRSAAWRTYFWKRGLELEPCEFRAGAPV